MFPRVVLIELHDSQLRAQVIADGRPGDVRFEVPLPPETCRDGMPLEKEPLADLIGDLMVRDNLIEAFAMVALPPAAAQWRVVEWPRGRRLPQDPLEATRELDAAALNFPFPLADAVVDAQPLPGGDPRLLVAASPRSLVDAWIEVFSLAGVQLERLAPAQSCEFLALSPLLQQLASQDLVALLRPEESLTRLLLFRDGIPRYERSVVATGAELVAELSRSIAFYRRTDPQVRGLRLLHSGPLPELQALQLELGVTAEPTSHGAFDSLVLQGLASLEVTP